MTANTPAQGQQWYSNAPYAPQPSPPGFQQQQNVNIQPHPSFQQVQLSPQPPYQQQRAQQVPSSQILPPQPTTWRRFMVPTNSDSISSGFQFHPQLYNLQVRHEEWHEFTTEIVEGAKLSATEDAAAWSAGASVGAVSSAFLLVFGPPIGYYTGKAIHKKTVVKKVKERMLENGSISAILNKWNQRNFKWRGFQVWLECPTDHIETTPGAPRHQAKAEKKEAQRFRLVVIPNSEIHEPYSAAPWSQPQPGAVEAPSVEPQRPVELQSTSSQNASLSKEPFKAAYPSAFTQASPASELDAQSALQESRPMPAELSG